MEKNKVRFQVAAGLAIGFFLASSLGLANSSSDSDELNDIAKLNSLIGPRSSQFKSDAQDSHKLSSDELLKKKLEQLDEHLKITKEEKALRPQLAKEKDRINTLKALATVPGILKSMKDQKRAEQTAGLRNVISKLKPTQSQLNPNSLDVSDLDESCSDKVDFSKALSFSDQVNSEKGEYVKKELGKLADKWGKEDKKKSQEALLNILGQIDGLIAKEDEPAENEDDPQHKSIFDQDNSASARLDRMKSELGELKQERMSMRKKAWQAFRDMIAQAFDSDDPTAKREGQISEIAGHFANSIKPVISGSAEVFSKGAKQLKKNCEKINERIGRDNPFGPDTWFNALYQWVVSYHRGNADYYANRELLQQMSEVNSSLKCRDSSATIDSLFGGNLKKAVDGISSARDVKTLVDGALKILNTTSSAISQAAQAVQPTKKDCQHSATIVKNIKEYIGKVKGMDEQARAEREKIAQEQGGMGPSPMAQSGSGGAPHRNISRPSADALTHRSGSTSR